jgi:hypothetical protein
MIVGLISAHAAVPAAYAARGAGSSLAEAVPDFEKTLMRGRPWIEKQG